MTICRCGAGIVWTQTKDGEKVPLDVVPSLAGERRYLVVDLESTPWLVAPVTATAAVAAYPDHRSACPRT